VGVGVRVGVRVGVNVRSVFAVQGRGGRLGRFGRVGRFRCFGSASPSWSVFGVLVGLEVLLAGGVTCGVWVTVGVSVAVGVSVSVSVGVAVSVEQAWLWQVGRGSKDHSGLPHSTGISPVLGITGEVLTLMICHGVPDAADDLEPGVGRILHVPLVAGAGVTDRQALDVSQQALDSHVVACGAVLEGAGDR